MIDAPENMAHDAQALSEEQSQTRATYPGFWHTVVQYIRRNSTHRLQWTSSADRRALRQPEAPMARLAQEHPTLFLLGCFGIPHG